MFKSCKTTVVIVSHHSQGGGKPLDSLWFSKQECSKEGINLFFLWTKRRRDLLKLILLSAVADYIIFDGIYSLFGWHGGRFYQLANILYKKLAIYWHETEYYAEKLTKKLLLRQALENSKTVHFHVCTYGIRMLEDKYGVAPKNTYLLNNISDSSRLLEYELPLKQEPFLFVGCGGVSERKGSDIFIEVAHRVISEEVSSQFVWVGGFGEGDFSEEKIFQEVERRGLSSKVTFTGHQSNPLPIIAKAHAFLLTSRDDPMPKVLMEALALGKSCVAFDIGGGAELLSNHGTVVPFGDVDKFVKSVLAIPCNQDVLEQASRREWYLRNYSPASFAARFAKALEWWKALP